MFAGNTDISNMGVAGLTIHAAGKKHKEILGLRQSNVGASFFQKQSSEQKQGSSSNSKPKTESMLIPASTLKAEVFWSLKVVSSHFSFRSCLGLNDLFKAMFIGSEIAKSFQLSKTKCDYLINYGLAPYFKDV